MTWKRAQGTSPVVQWLRLHTPTPGNRVPQSLMGKLRSHMPQFSSVQSLSRVWLFATPWTAAHQAFLSITNPWSLPKLMSIELVMPSNHLILCRALLLLPSIFPNIRVFSNESALLIRWPKYWSFSFNISPSNEFSGLISFRMDWLDLLAVQGTLKSLLQHHRSKASVLWCSAFFMVCIFHGHNSPCAVILEPQKNKLKEGWNSEYVKTF